MLNLASYAGGPLITNDAVTFGLLILVLSFIFYTSSLQNTAVKKFYTIVPSLLLCYFLPALLHFPLGIIAPEWFDSSFIDFVKERNLVIPEGFSFKEIQEFLHDQGIDKAEYKQYLVKSKLYFVASRYLLPASLILLCLGIDFKGIINLGPKALIMFIAATVGIMIGGPVALLIVSNVFPSVIETDTEVWKGLATIAGSWIGGGANQTAMKEIFMVPDTLFGTMVVVDVIVANIWMGFLLYGANVSDKIDRWLKADNSAIAELVDRVSTYRASLTKNPTTTDLMMIAAIAFGGVAISHFGADILGPFFENINEDSKETLNALGQAKYPTGVINEWSLSSLMSGFFWLIVICTTIGLALSFTRLRKMEGLGASKYGSIFIYILVATIGMKMNIGEVFSNLELFTIGFIWMLVHVIILLLTAYIIKAPFFFVAVGSQANVGGAASAPIVASAFNSSLAPVGVLMAVLGYAFGTYGALACAKMMELVG